MGVDKGNFSLGRSPYYVVYLLAQRAPCLLLRTRSGRELSGSSNKERNIIFVQTAQKLAYPRLLALECLARLHDQGQEFDGQIIVLLSFFRSSTSTRATTCVVSTLAETKTRIQLSTAVIWSAA